MIAILSSGPWSNERWWTGSKASISETSLLYNILVPRGGGCGNSGGGDSSGGGRNGSGGGDDSSYGGISSGASRSSDRIAVVVMEVIEMEVVLQWTSSSQSI